MNENERRSVLGAVARHEVFQDAYDVNRRWINGAGDLTPPDVNAMLRTLEAEGLIVAPERKPGDRRDLPWQLTDKALES